MVTRVDSNALHQRQRLSRAMGFVGIGSGMYRVLVRLESLTARAGAQAYPLQPSLKVDATLVLERRRLIEWMLDPLKQLTART